MSKDGGKTWGAPSKVAPLGTALLTNPDIPNPTSLDRDGTRRGLPADVAVDQRPGRSTWSSPTGSATGFNHVKLTKSTDGGKRWTTPVDVTETPLTTHSFNGTVEVTDDGTVAVLYYDFRNNTPAPGLPTDVWLAHSHDGGATWTEQHVYGPFDMENAPVARGWFLGDYMGLAAIADRRRLDAVLRCQHRRRRLRRRPRNPRRSLTTTPYAQPASRSTLAVRQTRPSCRARIMNGRPPAKVPTVRVIKESTGRSDDFCEAAVPALT